MPGPQAQLVRIWPDPTAFECHSRARAVYTAVQAQMRKSQAGLVCQQHPTSQQLGLQLPAVPTALRLIT